jgi:hypothetical protein
MDDPLGIGDKIGRAAAMALSLPPHMIESVPFSAPDWPPETASTQDFLVAALHRDLAGDARRNGGVVDEHRARTQRGERAIGAEHDIGQIIVVANAGDHRVGVLRGFGGAGGRARQGRGWRPSRPRAGHRCG